MKSVALFSVICGLAWCSPLVSQGKKVFNLDISEGGARFRQKIELDFAKKSMHISVPAHNTLDHTELYINFNTNRTVFVLPEKKSCYVTETTREMPAIEDVARYLNCAKKQPAASYESSDLHLTNYIIIEITGYRSLITELSHICPDEYSVNQLVPMTDGIKVSEELGSPTPVQQSTTAEKIGKRAVHAWSPTTFRNDCPIEHAMIRCRQSINNCFRLYKPCSIMNPDSYCEKHILNQGWECPPCCGKKDPKITMKHCDNVFD